MNAGGFRPLRLGLVLLVVVPQATLAAFVPAVPHIAADLGTSPSAVDRTLVFYMAGYAVAMVAAGAFATRIDPRRVQLAALSLHVLASVVVVTAPNIQVLTAARVLQAAGGGAGTVLARVYVQEALPERHRLAALTELSTAIALTPAITPPIVGLLVDHLPWRPVMLMLGVLGALAFVCAKRTLPQGAEGRSERGAALREVVARPAYWQFTAAICLAWCGYFTFTTFSSHTMQVHLGTSSTLFSMLYALVVVGYVVGSRTARQLSDSWELERILLAASILAVGATSVMVFGAWLLPDQPLVLALPMAVAMVGIGAAFPVCQAGMLRTTGTNARSASGLFFFLQMASGAVYTGVLAAVDPTAPEALSIAVLVPAVGLALLTMSTKTSMRAPEQSQDGSRTAPTRAG